MPVVSGELDNGVHVPIRGDITEVVRPRAWPRATRELTADLPPRVKDPERLRAMIWFAVGGLMTAMAVYLVV